MPLVTIFTGLLLTALSVWGYLGAEASTDARTALIPAYVGVPLLVLGLLALKESMLKHAMHAAAMLGLLGFLAAAGRLAYKTVKDGAIPAGRAGLAAGLMALLCGLFVALCVNSFLAARRRRRAAAGQTPASVP